MPQIVRVPVGVWKAAFKVCPLMGGGSLTNEWSKSRAALTSPVQVLPLCIQMHKFMGVE